MCAQLGLNGPVVLLVGCQNQGPGGRRSPRAQRFLRRGWGKGGTGGKAETRRTRPGTHACTGPWQNGWDSSYQHSTRRTTAPYAPSGCSLRLAAAFLRFVININLRFSNVQIYLFAKIPFKVRWLCAFPLSISRSIQWTHPNGPKSLSDFCILQKGD